jgi:D-alanyl-D-alanine carboxypeptidase/D-alanyl-D-alanine-endopeptidase (penicillin-binding protein 4)
MSNKIDSAINRVLPQATVSILVKDAKSGRLFFSRNANKLLAPASTIKLFTAAAALYYWQPEHRFTTELLNKKQDYFIRFGGSPSLTSNNLISLLTGYLNRNQIKEINGDIILDASIFQAPYYPNGISYDDLGWYYAAPDTAIILNGNTANYLLTTPMALGQPVQLEPKKNGQHITVLNEVITAGKEEAKDHCGLNVEIKPNNTLRLYGCVAPSKNPKLLQFAVPDPGFLAKKIIKELLRKNGIQFSGQLINGVTPTDASSLALLNSHPLVKLITQMLQESDNLYADNLTKQLGYAVTKVGSNKQAMFAVKEVLSQHTPIDMRQMVLADGIGTRYNLATTEQISILLSSIYKNKTLFNLFIQALPRAGVAGSLKNRMLNTPLEKIVYAKTGSRHDISALSGYMINPNVKVN